MDVRILIAIKMMTKYEELTARAEAIHGIENAASRRDEAEGS